MKKTLLFLFLTAMSLFSCKKTYTCNCDLTETVGFGGISIPASSAKSTSSSYSAKMSKAQAQSACDHEKSSLESSASSFYTTFIKTLGAFSGTATPTFSSSANCTLQ